MAKEVSIRELRNSTSGVVSELEAGERLTLTVNRRAIADTSVFVAPETGRELGELPTEIAVSVITAVELELGVLRATDPEVRATRLSTRIAAAERARGRRLRRHDTWIAATAIRHGVAVLTQDADFSHFENLDVRRV
jgi:predicted nucleic acid-binding protein